MKVWSVRKNTSKKPCIDHRHHMQGENKVDEMTSQQACAHGHMHNDGQMLAGGTMMYI